MASSDAAGPADVIQDLRAIDEEMVRAVAAGDAGAVSERYAEDARLFPYGLSAVHGRAAIREFWRGLFESGLHGLALDTTHVEVSGHLAYAEGRYAGVIAGSSVPAGRASGTYLRIYRRQDARQWRIVAAMYSAENP